MTDRLGQPVEVEAVLVLGNHTGANSTDGNNNSGVRVEE